MSPSHTPDLTRRPEPRDRRESRPEQAEPSGRSVILIMSVVEDAATRITEVNRWLRARRRPPLTPLASAPDTPMYGGPIADLPVKELVALVSALSWRHRPAVQLLVREGGPGWAVLGLRDEAS